MKIRKNEDFLEYAREESIAKLAAVTPMDPDDDSAEEDIALEAPFKIVLGPMYIPRSSWIEDQGWCVWLRDDPRSVTAMLHGKGDGREKLFERYSRYIRKKAPDITEANLAYRYAEYARHMDHKIAAETRRAQKTASIKQRWSFLESSVEIAFPLLGKRYFIPVSIIAQLAAVSGMAIWIYRWLFL